MKQFGLEDRSGLIKPSRNLSIKKLIKNHLAATVPIDRVIPFRGFKNRPTMWHDLMGHLVLISSLSALEQPEHKGISNMIAQRNNLLEAAVTNMYLYSSDRYTGDLSFKDLMKSSFDFSFSDVLVYTQSRAQEYVISDDEVIPASRVSISQNYTVLDSEGNDTNRGVEPFIVMYKKSPEVLEEYIESINLDDLVSQIEKRYEAFGRLMMKKYPKKLSTISKLTPFQVMQDIQDALLDRRQSLLDSEMVYDLVNRLTTKELIDAGVLTQDVFPHWRVLSEQ